MASIVNDGNGRRRIQFVASDGRRSIRLGKVTAKQAEAIKVRVEQLVGATLSGVMEPEAARWVAGLDDAMYGRLSAVGLVPPRERIKPTLGRLLDSFFGTLVVKPGTETTYKQTKRALLDYFGKDRLLSTITSLNADEWRQSMKDANLADATISRRIKTARQIFRIGMKWQMVAANPLADVKAGAQTNRERLYFVSREDAAKVLDACPDHEWRVLFALSRFGGLRCPSEHLGLRWQDVDWDRGRVLVTSPKTEGYEGRDSRWLPLFPELKPYLLDAFERAEPGAVWVITRYRDATANLRTQLNRIIKRAGLKPWPRLWHNLRSTRQTELAERYPSHVVCSWLGNSRAVAMDHYLQTTDAHFEAATREPNAVQNPAQQPAATEGSGVQDTPDTTVFQPVAAGCGEEVTPTA